MIILSRPLIFEDGQEEGKLSIIKYHSVSYESEGKAILRNISVNIASGDFISLVGPSGSGKTTFLKLCGHLISPTEGDIFFAGQNMLDYNPLELRRRVAYCFQTPYLFGKTVADNLHFPYTIRNKALDMGRIEELLQSFNLSSEILDREVQRLSGGEKQRISLIRTLVFTPEVLLLDEITSALDADNAILVEQAVAKLNQGGVTVLWITHNPAQNKGQAKRVFTIVDGVLRETEGS